MSQKLEKKDAVYALAEQRVNGLLTAMQAHEQAMGTLSDTLVHELRVCVKRLRALLQLYHPVAEKETLKSLDHELKAIAKAFAGKRDMVVQYHLLSHAIAAVRPHHQADFALLDHYFKSRILQDSMNSPPLSVKKSFKQALKKWRHTLSPHKRKTLAKGLSFTHDQCYQLAHRAIASGQDAAYHAARKWIKYYFYQLKLLDKKNLKKVDENAIKQLEEMGELLGELHDQAVLESTLQSLLSTAEASSALNAFDQHALRQAIMPILAWLQDRKGQYKQLFWPKFNRFFLARKPYAVKVKDATI